MKTFLLVCAMLGALVCPGLTQQRLDRDRTVGRYLSAAMTLDSVSQDSLAKVNLWLAPSQSGRVARISALRNGRRLGADTAQVIRDSVLRRLGGTLDSLFYLQLDTTAIGYVNAQYSLIYQRRHMTHPPVAPPNRTIAIASAGLTGNGLTYYLDVMAHGLPNLGDGAGTRVMVHGHRAVPSFDEMVLYAKYLSPDRVSLWRDAALTQGLRPTVMGQGGVVEVLR